MIFSGTAWTFKSSRAPENCPDVVKQKKFKDAVTRIRLDLGDVKHTRTDTFSSQATRSERKEALSGLCISSHNLQTERGERTSNPEKKQETHKQTEYVARVVQ